MDVLVILIAHRLSSAGFQILHKKSYHIFFQCFPDSLIL